MLDITPKEELERSPLAGVCFIQCVEELRSESEILALLPKRKLLLDAEIQIEIGIASHAISI